MIVAWCHFRRPLSLLFQLTLALGHNGLRQRETRERFVLLHGVKLHNERNNGALELDVVLISHSGRVLVMEAKSSKRKGIKVNDVGAHIRNTLDFVGSNLKYMVVVSIEGQMLLAIKQGKHTGLNPAFVASWGSVLENFDSKRHHELVAYDDVLPTVGEWLSIETRSAI